MTKKHSITYTEVTEEIPLDKLWGFVSVCVTGLALLVLHFIVPDISYLMPAGISLMVGNAVGIVMMYVNKRISVALHKKLDVIVANLTKISETQDEMSETLKVLPEMSETQTKMSKTLTKILATLEKNNKK